MEPFDYFHTGHEHYLSEARALGDQLIVVVARDETATRQRTKAMYNERRRLRDVSASPSVTKAVLGNADDKYKVIKNTNLKF